jgi:hypothetical protein
MPCANLGNVSITGYCSLADKYCVNCSLCPHYVNEPTSITQSAAKEAKTYCKYCFNARVYEPTDEEVMSPYAIHLTDDNDSSSHSIGVYEKEKRFMISSGNGEPVRIEFEYWEPQWRQWLPIGKYYPKYCPECGRRLNEYDKESEDN